MGDLSQGQLKIDKSITSLIHIAGIWLLPPHISRMHRIGLRRLVCFSSTAIYNKVNSVNASERKVARKMLAAEESVTQQCDAMGIKWTILRPTLIYGLGLDVYKGEPNIHPDYLNHPNAFVLPHLGSATEKTRTDMANLAISNIEDFFNTGKCGNIIN